MLSTPVCGVESKNDVVAPLVAPCLRRDAATGITPQEQRGRGMPKTVALITGQIPRPPRCRSTVSAEINTESSPATKNPNNR